MVAATVLQRFPMDRDAAPASRTLPHNTEAEKALLGVIFVDNRAYGAVAQFLKPEHFALVPHQRIFEAIKDTIDTGGEANPITLNGRLAQDDLLADIGGIAYLAELMTCAVSVMNAGEYGRIIVEDFSRLKVIEAAEDAVNAAYQGAQSAADVMAGLEAALVEIGDTALAREAQGAVWWHQVMDETMGLVDKTARGEGPTGLKTGLVDLDKVIGGLFAGELVILAGATSMGKTALAKQIAATVAQAGTPVLYHSLEMDGKQLAMRDMAAQAGVPLPAMRSGRLTDADLDAAMEAGTRRRALPILIDSRAGLDVGRLYAQARQTVARQNIGLIVVDYLQLLSPGQRYAGNRAAEVGEVSRALKRTARDLQVPVLAMSQLSRQVDSRDDNRPRLSDMRESGTIEQDADAVWLIYREEYYLKRKAPERGGFKSDSAYEEANASHQAKVDAARNKAELMVAKQRNGPTGTVKLRFDGARLRFENLDQNHHGEF